MKDASPIQGEKTDTYFRVQKQNKDINAMKGVFMNYDHKAFVLKNLAEEYKESIDENLRTDTYKELKSIDSKGQILVGCFDKVGKTGLYVMNFDYTKGTEVTLNLDNKYEFMVWGAKGLEQLETENQIKIELLPGEGRFIEIK